MFFMGAYTTPEIKLLRNPASSLTRRWMLSLDGESVLQAEQARCNQAGLDLMVVELSSLPKEMACYIIRRMAEYTASGFVQQFCEHQDDPDALEWLSREMLRVPISTEKAWKT